MFIPQTTLFQLKINPAGLPFTVLQ